MTSSRLIRLMIGQGDETSVLMTVMKLPDFTVAFRSIRVCCGTVMKLLNISRVSPLTCEPEGKDLLSGQEDAALFFDSHSCR